MKWIGERISFVEDKNKITIVIEPEKVNWFKPVMGAWVGMWYAIGAAVIWALFVMKLSQQEKIIVYVFLCFWVYYAQRVTRSFFWILWGKELLTMDESALFIKTSIRGYGKSKPYLLENIKKMNLTLPKPHSFQAAWEAAPWMKGGERIEFEYLGKIYLFGIKLNDQDAKLLFNYVTKKLDERLKKKRD